jgi:DNA-binding MarR family transcriptional regulator
MADINSERRHTVVPDASPAASQNAPNVVAERLPDTRAPSDEQLLAYVELLFFAYRDFTSDPDSILRDLGFGRAHHRVLHFVHRYPGLRVAELLQILKITKQSLARVLRELVAAGHIVQKTGPSDRRERLLYTTNPGAALAQQLARPQIERLARTLAASTSPAGGYPSPTPAHQDSARMFLYHLITPEERAAVDALMARRATKAEHPPQNLPPSPPQRGSS